MVWSKLAARPIHARVVDATDPGGPSTKLVRAVVAGCEEEGTHGRYPCDLRSPPGAGLAREREHLIVKDFPVQFLAAAGPTEDAVREARSIEYEGLSAKVFRPEHIIAIAASVRRHKDLARIEQLLEQVEIKVRGHPALV